MSIEYSKFYLSDILNEVKNLSDTVTGLPSKITEELPINKKCLEQWLP